MKTCQKCLGSCRQKSVPERKDTCVKRLIIQTWGTFRDKYAPELEPQSLLKPSQQCYYTLHDPSLLRRPTNQSLCAQGSTPGEDSARTLTLEGVCCSVQERLDQAKVQQAHTGPQGAGPGPGLLIPSTKEHSVGMGEPHQIVAQPCTPPDGCQLPGKNCWGALLHLSKQANMTTICPKGFLVPWQHTKHELLPPFSGEICKARDSSV